MRFLCCARPQILDGAWSRRQGYDIRWGEGAPRVGGAHRCECSRGSTAQRSIPLVALREVLEFRITSPWMWTLAIGDAPGRVQCPWDSYRLSGTYRHL